MTDPGLRSPVRGTISLVFGGAVRHSHIAISAGIAAIACALLLPATISASELVYVPVNPNFGGSPFNAAGLLSSAQATNKHEDPRTSNISSALGRTPLQQFNESLERSVLSQLASAATSNVIAGGKIVPGTVQTGNFTIVITDLGGGLLDITTTDKVTGASTSFQVNSQ